MGTPPGLAVIFSQGSSFCDFLFAYLDDKGFSKWGIFLKLAILYADRPC